MKDNIRASAVCKTWHDIAVSVRDRSPLLVYFNVDLSGVSYGFFDPREKKTTKAMKLSYQFFDARLCQSKKGWLLMEHNHEGIKRLFFFNPFTREHIYNVAKFDSNWSLWSSRIRSLVLLQAKVLWCVALVIAHHIVFSSTPGMSVQLNGSPRKSINWHLLNFMEITILYSLMVIFGFLIKMG